MAPIGIYKTYCKQMGIKAHSTIGAHLRVLRKLLAERDKNRVFWAAALKAATGVVDEYARPDIDGDGDGADDGLYDFKFADLLPKPGAKRETAAQIRDDFFRRVEAVLQLMASHYDPVEKVLYRGNQFLPLLQSNRVVIEPRSLLNRLTKNAHTKIASIYDLGRDHTGHGRTTALEDRQRPRVFHAHVENGDGVAFYWRGGASTSAGPAAPDVLVIVAYGTKVDRGSTGTSGYKWYTK